MFNLSRIFEIKDSQSFEIIAMELFRYQAESVPVYRDFLNYLRIDPSACERIEDIPFLPVELFRTHKIIAEGFEPSIQFTSSSTGGSSPSVHYVADAGLYEKSFMECFRRSYGQPSETCIMALLPSYLERPGSSLVYMADKLIGSSRFSESKFYLYDLDVLIKVLKEHKKIKRNCILLGVSFALLDMAEKFEEDLNGIIIMETGGMKGRRKEMIRKELHDILMKRFNVDSIHSEYGMTELLSQAYSKGNGIFSPPPWMKILIRDNYDPATILPENQSGRVNIIDLANVYSCSFLATSDLGKVFKDGSFEILGRADHSDIRGCNLMIP